MLVSVWLVPGEVQRIMAERSWLSLCRLKQRQGANVSISKGCTHSNEDDAVNDTTSRRVLS